jgi:LysM repeat protein
LKDLSQVLLGILAALVSVGIILGSFALSIAESGFPVALVQEEQLTSTIYPTSITIVDTPAPGEPTFTPSPTISIAHRQTSVTTTTLLQPVNCPLPEGWISIIIEPGDTLERLANAYDTTPDDLALNNCLVIDTLIPGTVLWVPKVDRAGKVKPPAEKCGPPSTWVFYIVKPGDTLYGLSLTTGTSVSQLQWANCLGSSTVIRVGQSLYLPFIPKPTPTRKPVILPTFTSTPTRTPPPANNPPTANPQSVNSSEDTPIEIILTGSDPDGDTLTFYVVNDPMHGVLFGIPPLLTYAPDTGFTGADSFFFVANDGWVDSPPAKVSITITPDNEAPVANPQSVVTEQDTPVGITLTGSDPDGDTLTFSIVTTPVLIVLPSKWMMVRLVHLQRW